ncbi:hypothetical protein [Paraburkholderia phenazinium]|uniref:Uncharacterized protein n=1 Tax=Paraburkholderia phenazinium TaxID=60549 RepID=A0A1G7TFQ7_9BURK|nr:hypothetical protein [Paraburkholderia phenazinium]SDG34148.1 hypothetical protein SAMN05216466_1033 [Paraburkholderia phenazinium]
MIRTYAVLLVAILLAVLAGCGNKEGDEFVGKWQSTKSRESIEISRNDDGFIIANTTSGGMKGAMASASYRNGVLEVNATGGAENVIYDKQHDRLVLPTMTGMTPFERVK